MGGLLVPRPVRPLPRLADTRFEVPLKPPRTAPGAALAGNLLNLLVVAVPITLLATLASPGVAVGVAVGIGAAGAAWAFAYLRRTRDDDWSAIPLLVGIGYGVALAPNALLGSGLAGLAGLTLLYWLARDRATVARPRDVVRSLMLPAVAVFLAIGSALLLPAPSEAVGLAAAIVVAALLLVAWVYRSLAFQTASAVSPPAS